MGRRIRARRRDLGLTQTDLATPEYTKSFISQLEGGHADPSLDTLRFLGKRLQMGLSSMAGDAADQRLSVMAGMLDWAGTANGSGRADSARRAIELVREMAAEAGSVVYAADALLLLADLELEAGNLDRVEEALREAAHLPFSPGSRFVARLALTQGLFALRRADPARAAAAFRGALGDVRKTTRFPDLAVRALIGVAVASISLGEFRVARRRLRSAINLATRYDLARWRGRALIVLAELSRLEGRVEEADRYLQEASRALAWLDDRLAEAEMTKAAGERSIERLV